MSDAGGKKNFTDWRVFTDDVFNYRLAFLSKGEIPPTGLSPTPTSSRSPLHR